MILRDFRAEKAAENICVSSSYFHFHFFVLHVPSSLPALINYLSLHLSGSNEDQQGNIFGELFKVRSCLYSSSSTIDDSAPL